jgi:hypothetical protein
MNKTCARVIKKAFGPETDSWVGKRIELYPTTCESFGDVVECIRVRIPNGSRSTPAPEQKQSEKTAAQIMDEKDAAEAKRGRGQPSLL